MKAILFVLLLTGVAAAQFSQLPQDVRHTMMRQVTPLRVVYNRAVQMELEVVQEQREKIDRMFKEHRAAGQLMMEAAALIQNNDERAEYITDTEAANVTRSMEVLREILLPHQLKRLDQLTLRQRVEQFGLPILRDEPEITHLGFPGETLDRLQEVTDKAHAEKEAALQAANKAFAEAIKKAEADCNEKILTVLTPTQRKALEELLGPPLKSPQGGQ